MSGGDNKNIICFGKYQGHDLEDVPRNYLEWCLENLDPTSDFMVRELEKISDFLEGGEALKLN